eukprot:TRINITY_DN8363_c0_g1_i2.p1 TRINITY_DN8363_c0_g1~~TRINITY_DN8363_c0_g1_i2.p1  ORF type:complete len:126 (-),score=20.84 TRINITY_DN8363_c0_g1_i2:374-751(-)
MWPVGATEMLDRHLSQTFGETTLYLRDVFQNYLKQHHRDLTKPHGDFMKMLSKVDRQMYFIAEASQEPLLWRPPFPHAAYEKIVQCQFEVMRTVFLCDILMVTARESGEVLHDLCEAALRSVGRA